jgi:hypothetical protein
MYRERPSLRREYLDLVEKSSHICVLQIFWISKRSFTSTTNDSIEKFNIMTLRMRRVGVRVHINIGRCAGFHLRDPRINRNVNGDHKCTPFYSMFYTS